MVNQEIKTSAKLRSITTTGRRNGPLRTTIDVRKFNFIIDEPEKLGGKDEAPTPLEYVTGALGGCFTVTIELIIREFEFSIEDLEISCSGLVDNRGLFGTADVSPHFQFVEVQIRLKSDIPPTKQIMFQDECLKRCPVYNLIKDSGAAISVHWNHLTLD